MSKAISVEQLETSLSAVNNKMNTKLQEVVEVNLDLNNIPQEYTKFQDTPVGHILSFIGTTAPEHYLICDGSVYNIANYPELARYFLKEFGEYNYFGGDGVTTFAVPDMRGEFVRGYDPESIRDPEGSTRGIGKHQDATEHINLLTNSTGNNLYTQRIADTTKVFVSANNTDDSIVDSGLQNKGSYVTFTSSFATQTTDASHYTSRPTNVNVLFCIKYESTLCINTGTIINTPNPLTTEPLEYGTFKCTTISSGRLLFDTVNGNITNQNNLITLKAGVTYRLDASIQAISSSTGTQYTFYIVNNSDGSTIDSLTAMAINDTRTALFSNSLSSFVCLDKDTDIYMSVFDTVYTSVGITLAIQEIRNNPVNQYGGFQITKLFEGSMKTSGQYTLLDYVKNYSLILVECTDYATDKKDITPVMTSNTTPTPYVVSGFTAFGTDALYGYFTAAGSNTITNTTTGSGDVILDFGTKTKVNLIEITPITTGSSRESYRARTITIFGSNDGSTYTQIYKSTTDLVTLYGANTIPISFDTVQEYRYYKFTLFSVANSRVGVNKIKFYTTSPYDVTDKIEYFVPDARGFKISDNTILVGENTLTGYINNDLVEVYGIYGELPSLLSGGEF